MKVYLITKLSRSQFPQSAANVLLTYRRMRTYLMGLILLTAPEGAVELVLTLLLP